MKWASMNSEILVMLTRHHYLSHLTRERDMKTRAQALWHRGHASGLEKRQCTVQLTVFADGKARVKPLLIFHGTGLRITAGEKRQYDGRVVVRFQENAWCDEEMMKFWIRSMWRRPFGENARNSLLARHGS